MPAPGSEPLAFKSVFAASLALQAKACTERALKQVSEALRARRTAGVLLQLVPALIIPTVSCQALGQRRPSAGPTWSAD